MAKRWSGGLAFSPERELQVFREMALKGEHLTGTAMAGHGWEFTPGEKEDVIFDMTTEPDADDDFSQCASNPVGPTFCQWQIHTSSKQLPAPLHCTPMSNWKRKFWRISAIGLRRPLWYPS